MKRWTVTMLAVIACSLLVLSLGAAEAGKPAVITGYVVDTGCWLGHNMRGPDHIKCAAMCARNGVPLAILDTATDTLYIPVAIDHKNPNEKLLDYVESKVKVTGRVIEKSGVKGVIIEKIERAS